MRELQWRQLLAQPMQPTLRRLHEFRIGAAHLGIGVLQQPGRKPAELPLGTHIGARPKNHIQAFLLRLTDEFGDVVLPTEVVVARRRFVRIPEHVGGNGIEAHRLGHLQARSPIFTRHSGVMHLAGDDPKRLAIEHEVALLDGEAVIGWCRRCHHVAGEQCTEQHTG